MLLKVYLIRAWQDDRATLGMLSIEGVKHDPIFTLENPKRATSEDSLIPAGVYTCIPYSGTRYKDVYLVKDVPGRSAILFHWGNTERDTKGCILLGLIGGMMGPNPAVKQSKDAFALFSKLIGKQNFELRIIDVSS